MSSETPQAAAGKHLVVIHGRGVKPEQDVYTDLWREALHAGIQRDYPKYAERFSQVPLQMVYFGDLTHGFDKAVDPLLDLADRRAALATLAKLDKPKRFRRSRYEQLPGKSALREFLADVGAPIATGLGLGKRLASRVVPELHAYWNNIDNFATTVDERFNKTLTASLDAQADVMVIAHCIGSLIAFNGLWQTASLRSDKVHTLLTIGSPLGDETAKRNLYGAAAKGADRYPNNVLNWHNVAAEDDYISHDKTVSDDYKTMLDARLIGRIVDHRIYNLAVRYGRSNPHSSVGYLIHPRTARLVAQWLAE